ncbi:MAG: sulfite oxidase-like oxidoreductase [Chloroflexi bacterium]|nr:sulfite oxidase-like oxidoreductase [Chloroflexota bacterium]
MRNIPEGMEDRVPPGQYVTPKMPVMNMGFVPKVPVETWTLQVFGQVEEPVELDWEGFLALAQQTETVDFHCVTQWSRLNVGWEGVPAGVVLDLARPKPDARFVMLHCADGYTTNLALDAVRAPDALFAHRRDGAPLEAAHGAPVRLVVPARYGWKSAKWVTGVELLTDDAPGFWEQNGYHMRGDPWAEERFARA